MPWVFGLVLKWHDNSELSLLGDASAKLLDPTKFQSWIVNFQVEVCAKACYEGKGRKTYTKRKSGECFQRKTNASCSRRDACGFPRETVRTTWTKVEVLRKFSLGANILFRLTENLNSLKASPVTKAQKPSSMVGKMKNIVV